MLDISLAVRVSREGETGVRNDARGDVSFNVLAVKVLLGSVSRTKVVDERTNFDALGSLPSSVLHESSEGSGTSKKRLVSTNKFIQVKKDNFQTYPVPRPAMMMGCLLSGGSFMTDGLMDTVTLAPGLRSAKYLVH